MKITVLVARILLGLLFLGTGLLGFVVLNAPPPMPPGLARTFMDVFFQSRWVVLVDTVEVIAGVLLLTNRFVPLALTLLAAVLANILAYHVTMLPSGLPLPLFATLLWVIVALPLRAHFAPLFAKNATYEFRSPAERATR